MIAKLTRFHHDLPFIIMMLFIKIIYE